MKIDFDDENIAGNAALFGGIEKSREGLPYRRTAEGIICYHKEGRAYILAQNRGKYLALPGGGVEGGDSVEDTLKKEALEETGAVITNIREVCKIQFDWPPSFADTEKRKARYAAFRGEEIVLCFASVEEFRAPTSTEGDEWKGEMYMEFKDAAELAEKFAANAVENEKSYKLAQYLLIKAAEVYHNME